MRGRRELLQVAAVSRVFRGGGAGEVVALEGVSFAVREGEFVCLVGPSGCGKSTLLSLVAGLDRPSSGQVLLDGQPVAGPGPDRVMVFQRDCLFPWLTVLQNVRFGLTLRASRRRLPPERQRRRLEQCQELLEAVGLARFAEAYPRELSGGMRQRVAIARALVGEPRVLLMDEPFGALDAQTREEMQELLLALCQRWGTTVLFVTHDVEEAVFLADRVLVMQAQPGRIASEVTVPLARPRRLPMKLEPDFQRVRREVLGDLYRRQGLSVRDDARSVKEA